MTVLDTYPFPATDHVRRSWPVSSVLPEICSRGTSARVLVSEGNQGVLSWRCVGGQTRDLLEPRQNSQRGGGRKGALGFSFPQTVAGRGGRATSAQGHVAWRPNNRGAFTSFSRSRVLPRRPQGNFEPSCHNGRELNVESTMLRYNASLGQQAADTSDREDSHSPGAQGVAYEAPRETEGDRSRVDETELEEEPHVHGSGSEADRDARFRVTLRLVETAMLAATAGVAYFLANNLRIEGYFGFFFPLPAVICAVRWGPDFGFRCMMATALLLFVLSGPLKAVTFVLVHGLFGSTIGYLWSVGAPWPLSVLTCALVRTAGLTGFVLVSSWLIRENILKLILMNLQAGLTLFFSTLGLDFIPPMRLIYSIFYSLLIFNSCMFSFLIHLIFTLFLRKLGMETSFRVPAWLDRSLSQ